MNCRTFAYNQKQHVLNVLNPVWEFRGHLFAKIATDCLKAGYSSKSRQHGLFRLNLSIFHSNAKTHDCITGNAKFSNTITYMDYVFSLPN